MILHGAQIVTPSESLALYSPSWRHEVARCLADAKETVASLPSELRRDRELCDQAEYLRTGGDAPAARLQVLDLANAVFDRTVGNLRPRLEALLLTHATLPHIAEDTGMDPKAASLYEKLFFNVRGAEGTMMAPVSTRMRFALGTEEELGPDSTAEATWKFCAVRYGAGVLADRWGWPAPASARDDSSIVSSEQAMAEALAPALLERLVSRRADGKMLADMFAAALGGRAKMEEARIKWAELELEKSKDSRKEKAGKSGSEVGIVLGMLEGYQPRRISIQRTDAEKTDINVKLAEKAKASPRAQAQVPGQKIDRKDALALLDAELQGRIREKQ